jgi:membrane-bound inhibitor of C-type lysozyme
VKHLFALPLACGLLLAATELATIPAALATGIAFTCDDGKRVSADFDAVSGAVQLEKDGKTITLPQVEAASGSRYADGAIEFWDHGGEAMLTLDGKTAKCAQTP